MSSHCTSARALAGESGATFKLRLPDGGSVRSTAERRLAKVTSLSALSDTLEIVYKLRMSFTFTDGDPSVYNGYFQDPLSSDSATPLTLSTKLDNWNENLARKYSAFPVRPSVTFWTDPVNDQKRFRVTLPGYTSLYINDPGWWPTLGFPDEAVTVRELKMKSDKSPGAVYGFFNEGTTTFEIFSKPFSGGEFFNLFHPRYGGRSGRVYMEASWESLTVPLESSGPKGVTRMEAINEISEMIDYGLRLYGVADTAISVTDSGEDVGFAFTSQASWGDCPLVITITFDDQLAHLLTLEKNTMTFPMQDRRGYVAKPRKNGEDVLADEYPLKVVVVGKGDCVDYVEGIGYCSIIGHANDASVFGGRGCILRGEEDVLTVYIVNKSFEKIEFKEDVRLFLSLEFENLS
jgi:hypothetical protein